MKSLFKTSITEMKNATIIGECDRRLFSTNRNQMNFIFNIFSGTLDDTGVWDKFIDGEQCGVAGAGSGASIILHFYS